MKIPIKEMPQIDFTVLCYYFQGFDERRKKSPAYTDIYFRDKGRLAKRLQTDWMF